jgi:hypothetical protein
MSPTLNLVYSWMGISFMGSFGLYLAGWGVVTLTKIFKMSIR